MNENVLYVLIIVYFTSRIPSSMTDKVSSWLNGNSDLLKEVGIYYILL